MKKTITKILRVSQDEWEYIKSQMQQTGFNFSQYALSKMLETNKTTKKQAKAKENRELIIELARWGNNLNQVSKHLNTSKSGLDRVGLEMLKRIEEHLRAIREANGC